jgi:maltooligosyltrehalose trehalohydrolase
MTTSSRLTTKQPLGATLDAEGRCHFRVWAPAAEQVKLHLLEPQDRLLSMEHDSEGYFHLVVEGVPPGTLYKYQLKDGFERPDPASRSQPQGVHGPSQVIASEFDWTDDRWVGIPLDTYIFYELHVGTFTPEGTFEAIIPHLEYLKSVGVTAIEIMPVGQFPGERNWGYDGVAIYAVQHSYGGAEGLKRLVNACHEQGLAVVLDVVYNHLGPEGNYLNDYGPYFTERYHTPWGAALNFDGLHSDHVRRYFIDNALYWITEFHIDALRLDATHAMLDFSADTFLEVLVESVHQQARRLNRHIHLIAENDRSDDRLLRPRELGGYALDAQWSDDLHHVLHTLLTGEAFGYYEDYGKFPHLVSALKRGYVYAGEYSPFRGRHHGTFKSDLPAQRFVVCTQNHDQVGNRMNGDRLSQLVSFDSLKLAAGIVLLSPYLPLLFMGEEFGSPSPFLFFSSFEDPELATAVSRGRKEEFAGHNWDDDVPDPQDEDTFQQSKLDHSLRDQGKHRLLLDFYRELIRLRKTTPALSNLDKDRLEVIGYERDQVLFMHRWYEDSDVIAMFNFSSQPVRLTLPVPRGEWKCVLHSAEARWQEVQGVAAISEVPAWDSDTSATLSLPATSFILLTKLVTQDND